MEALQLRLSASPSTLLLSHSSTSASYPPANGSNPLHLELPLDSNVFQDHSGLNLLSQPSDSSFSLNTTQPTYLPYQYSQYLDQEVQEAERSSHGFYSQRRRYHLGASHSSRRGSKKSGRLESPVSAQEQYLYIREVYRNNFPDVICPSIDQVRTNARVLLKRFLAYEAYEKYRNKTNKSNKDAKWPNDREYLFFEACVIYPPVGRMKLLTPKGQMGRNELIALHIAQNTGIICHRKQVSSHIQVLKAKCNYDPIIFSHLAKPEPRPRIAGYSSRGRNDPSSANKFRIAHFEMTVSVNGQKLSLLTSLDPQRGQLADMDRNLINKSSNSTAYFCNLAQTMAPRTTSNRLRANLGSTLAEVIEPGTQIMLVQATLDIPTYLPKGAELTVDFNIAGFEGLSGALGGDRRLANVLECSTYFYQGTRLLEKITKPVEFDPSDCTFKGISLGSTFWAGIIPRLVSKLRSTTTNTACLTGAGQSTGELTGREMVEVELNALNAVQEIYCKPGRGGHERLLILVWHFELAEKSRQGELYWRHVLFSDDDIGKEEGEHEDETGSALQSPLIGTGEHGAISLGDYMMAKGLYMNRSFQDEQPEFDFNNLEIPMPGSSSSFQVSDIANSFTGPFGSFVTSPSVEAFSMGSDLEKSGASFATAHSQCQSQAEMCSIDKNPRNGVKDSICIDMVESLDSQATEDINAQYLMDPKHEMSSSSCDDPNLTPTRNMTTNSCFENYSASFNTPSRALGLSLSPLIRYESINAYPTSPTQRAQVQVLDSGRPNFRHVVVDNEKPYQRISPENQITTSPKSFGLHMMLKESGFHFEEQSKRDEDWLVSPWDHESPGKQLQAPPSSPQKLNFEDEENLDTIESCSSPRLKTNELIQASSHALHMVLGLEEDSAITSTRDEPQRCTDNESTAIADEENINEISLEILETIESPNDAEVLHRA